MGGGRRGGGRGAATGSRGAVPVGRLQGGVAPDSGGGFGGVIKVQTLEKPLGPQAAEITPVAFHGVAFRVGRFFKSCNSFARSSLKFFELRSAGKFVPSEIMRYLSCFPFESNSSFVISGLSEQSTERPALWAASER